MQIPKDILHLHILHYIILLLQPISDQSSPCKSSRRSHTASSKSAKATATQSSEVQITRPVRDISPSVSGIFHRTSLGGRSVLAEIRCKNEGLYRMTSKNLSNLMRNILNHIKSYLKPHCFQLHFLKLQPFLSLLIHVSKGAPSRPQGVLQSLQQRLRLCSFPWFRFCFTLELWQLGFQMAYLQLATWPYTGAVASSGTSWLIHLRLAPVLSSHSVANEGLALVPPGGSVVFNAWTMYSRCELLKHRKLTHCSCHVAQPHAAETVASKHHRYWRTYCILRIYAQIIPKKNANTVQVKDGR